MNAASGETASGGDMTLCAAVEGLSLDILCVLDLGAPGLGEVAIMSGEN